MSSRHRYPAQPLVWQEVTSSNVEAVAHRDGRMYVRFKGGAVYEYPGVSRQRAVACRCSASVGHYINRHIIPNFEAVKIT